MPPACGGDPRFGCDSYPALLPAVRAGAAPPAEAEAPPPEAGRRQTAMESRSVGVLAEEREWDALLRRLATDEGRGEACEEGWWGLPLHYAALRGAPVEVVRALMDAYPEGARKTDDEGCLPLHFAATVEVVRALLDANPEGAGMADEDGRLPLHVAAARRAPVEVIRALLDAYPEGARKTDDYGNLPLHFAAAYGAPVDVVRMLVDAYPGAANIEDNKGRTPGQLTDPSDHPKLYVMLALARAGRPPNQPWTEPTHSVLRQVAAEVPNSEASALIDAHVSRVRELLRNLRRLGIPPSLNPFIVGKVDMSDIFE